jgi:hypothetical protein
MLWRHFGKPTPYITVMSVAVDKPKNRTADSLFPPDKYVNKPGVVVFAEHRTRLRDGTPVTYDREVLEKIARNCNRRIEETGNYAAVCIGHTDEDGSDKPLIGFAGPFRVEERDGRAVIVADFHIFKEDVDELKRYPRPSPEVWIPRDGFDPERIFLDPIAMLGAETPRLDLGMTFLYHARDGDLYCEKYAATLPAPGSVTVPAFETEHRKTEYAMAALTPEDIQAILKAIESTDWYKWVRQQMAASEKPGEQKTENGQPPVEDKATKTAYAKESDDEPDDEPDQDSDDAVNKAEAEPARPERDKDRPKRVEEYRCTTHYAKREAVLEAQREIYQLRRELEHERALRVNSERRRILDGLARRYAVNVDEEMELCRYGRMDDKEFQRHVQRIEAYYRPLPVGTALPGWTEAYSEPEMTRETYQRQQERKLSDKARDYVTKLANRGQWISYEEALELAQKGKI